MRKIAIPVTNNRLSSHFGHCEKFYLYEINDGTIVKETQLTPPKHEPGVLPKWLDNHYVTDVIAGGLGQRAIHQFNQHGINVFVGAPVMNPSEVVESHLDGSLELSENSCGH